MSGSTLREFGRFALKVIIVHCLTYFLFGLIMSNLFHYEDLFQREIIRDFMLPLNTRSLLGVAMQPVRGLLFAVALWPFRRAILQMRHGWLAVWLLFLVFAILSTTSAAPSSIEGMLYTKLPLWYHLIGLPEITLQTLAFSYILVWWDKRELAQKAGLQRKTSPVLSQLFMAVVVACFAYIGYAISSLALFFLSDTDIDFSEAAGDIKNQLIFVIAFLCNVVFVFFISKAWLAHKIPLWGIFLLAWVLDSLALFVCQLLFYGSSSPTTALLIGLLPAAIIAVGIRQIYRRAGTV